MKLNENIQQLLKQDFIRFCIVGASGFVINTVLLTLFFKVWHWPLFVAQLVGGEIALFSNFLLHHNWTYRHKKVKKTILELLIQFHLTSWAAIIGSAALVSGGVRYLHVGYLIALALSSIIALGWNFIWSKYVIWKHHQEQEDIHE